MSSIMLQKSIKDNSEELQGYLRDLKIWETDIKNEDKQLIEKQGIDTASNSEETLPVRNTIKPVRNTKNTKQNHIPVMTQHHEKKKSQTRISSYDYDAWEKFDVDKALNSDTDEEEVVTSNISKQSESTAQTQPKECKPQSEDTVQQETKPTKDKNLQTLTTTNNVTSQNKERAEALKEEGNLYYSKGKLSDAVAKYTQGIGLNPYNPILPANRAMAYIKLKKFKVAEKDCTKAIQLDPKYIKAYLRRATARVHIGNHSGALEDYEKVLQLEPWNKDAKKELAKLKQESSPQSDNKNSRDSPEEEGVKEESNKFKKLKVQEVHSAQDEKRQEDPNIIPAVTKPLHSLSTKPLTDVPVIEVNSKKEIEALINIPKEESISSQIITKTETEAQPHTTEKVKKDVSQPSVVPRPPRTSHQFSQDWRKVAKFEDLALTYLKNIPPTFFHGTEVEVDQLVEVVQMLCVDTMENNAVVPIMKALMKSRGFFLNIAFLEARQTEVFNKLLTKLENCEEFKEELKQLKDVF